MSNPQPAAPSMILCPYCGTVQKAPADKCRVCHGFFDPLSRRVSQQHMGPWFIRDSTMPFRPGCSYEVIRKQCQRGKIKPDTILRGPTTRQFWTVAWRVPGVAHLIGFCHSCELQIPPNSQRCPKCNTLFMEPGDRHTLGLDGDNPQVMVEAAAARMGTAPAPQPQAATAASAILSPQPFTPPKPVSEGRVASMPGFGTPAQARVVETRSLDDYQTPDSRSGSGSSTPAIVNNMTGEAAGVGDSPDWMEGDGGYDTQDRMPSEHGYAPPARKSSGTLVWAMVGLNVILVLIIGGVMLTGENHSAHDPLGDSSSPRPAAPSGTQPTVTAANSSRPAATTGSPTQTPVSQPTHPAPSVHDPATNGSPIGGTPFVNSGQPRRVSNVNFFGSTFSVDDATGLTDEQAKAFQVRFNEAAADAARGDYKAAVLKLEKIKADLPFGVRNAGLDSSIDKLNDLIRQSQNTPPPASAPAQPSAPNPGTAPAKPDDRKELEDFFR